MARAQNARWMRRLHPHALVASGPCRVRCACDATTTQGQPMTTSFRSARAIVKNSCPPRPMLVPVGVCGPCSIISVHHSPSHVPLLSCSGAALHITDNNLLAPP